MESDTAGLIASVPVVTRAGEGSPERRAGKSWQMGVSEMERVPECSCAVRAIEHIDKSVYI